LREIRNSVENYPSDTVEISGIVDSFGPGGAMDNNAAPKGDEIWTVSFSFALWRDEHGQLQDSPLRVEQVGGEDLVDAVMDAVDSETIIKIAVKPYAKTPGAQSVTLVEVIGPGTDDADLAARLAEMVKPLVFDDHQFGTFTFDRRVEWFEANVVWNGRDARLSIPATSIKKARAGIEVARSLWDKEQEWLAQMEACAVRDLLDLANDWSEDEEPVSTDAFKSQITIESIGVEPTGEFTAYFADGDLFWGHVIVVSGTISDGPERAEMQG
jgi:hypothetical protein